MSLRRLVVLAVVGLIPTVVVGLTIHASSPTKTVRIIYTNDTLGYLEPCGCGGRRTGGLPKRVTAISKLIEENPNTVIVESGNLVISPDKLDIVMSVLKQLRYDAVGMGSEDWHCSNEFFSKAAAAGIHVVDPLPQSKPHALPSLVKTVCGVKVGIVSFGSLPPFNELSDFEIRKARYQAYKAARASSDLLIVLDQARVVTEEWINRNAKRLGAPDIVIGGQLMANATEPIVIGKTRIVPTGIQGRMVGYVDVKLEPGKDPALSVNTLMLDESVAEDEATSKNIKELQKKIAEAQKQLVLGDANDSTSASSFPKNAVNPYYSPQLCKTCHVMQYEDWVKTDHAHAIKTLQKENKLIAECLICHSESFRRVKRSTVPKDGIGGVECATCHYESLPHGMERKNAKIKQKVDTGICLGCHDQANSPNFNFDTYMPRVNHSGVADTKGATGNSFSKSSP